MTRPAAAPRSMVRLFAVYAVISLVPVLVLGLVLASSYRHEAKRRGLAEGRSEAALLARTAVQPQLDGNPLAGNIIVSRLPLTSSVILRKRPR